MKLIELEDRSKRNNLGIDRLDKKPSETREECEARVQELIEVNLGITDAIEFDRCHRISAQTSFSKNQNRPRTIICRSSHLEVLKSHFGLGVLL